MEAARFIKSKHPNNMVERGWQRTREAGTAAPDWSSGLGVPPAVPRFFYGDLNDRPECRYSKNSTTFVGRLPKCVCFLATSIVEREHAWNRQWIF